MLTYTGHDPIETTHRQALTILDTLRAAIASGETVLTTHSLSLRTGDVHLLIKLLTDIAAAQADEPGPEPEAMHYDDGQRRIYRDAGGFVVRYPDQVSRPATDLEIDLAGRLPDDPAYHYRLHSLAPVVEYFQVRNATPGGYIASDAPTDAIRDTIEAGYRWVDTQHGYAIFEKAT